MEPIRSTLQKNLDSVHQQISAACQRSGRQAGEVQVVAVTKYAEPAWIPELARLHPTFGENRPQQLADRQQQLPNIRWHLIGQLQRNKVNLALRHATMIHSIDSLKLLEAIRAASDSTGFKPSILLQVNLSGEASKSGFSPIELVQSWPDVLRISSGLPVEGLMTMAAESDDPESARPVFRGLRELRDTLRHRQDSIDSGLQLPQLSMGMSGDFLTAVEEGATLVRIGSRLFSGLQASTT
ncbi:MAG: hypothetical protein RLZZ232_388 [Planctomycetota bacterium]|jgi:pyridoxal phosphate enzyme (YggS family)